MKTVKYILTLLLVTSGTLVQAEDNPTLEKLFKSMSSYRGPMGKNVTVGTGGRVITPSFPSGVKLFQGSFRSNDWGRPMAQIYDFYVGNYFASNYYELMETYVFGVDSNLSQPDTATYNPRREPNEAALIAEGAKAQVRAASMARHWVLEKYYVSKNPKSVLALSFQRWGVGDSADEQRHASAFLNFYLSSMTSDLQFLPAYLLIRQSPVGDSDKSPSLKKARDLVADLPTDRGSLLSLIRNTIHNQLSPIAIDLIDQYKKQNGSLPSDLIQVRAILVSYFSFSPAKSAVIAKRLGLPEFEEVANLLADDDKNKRVSPVAQLLNFSHHAVDLKMAIATDKVATTSKADALLLLSYASQYLNSRLTNSKNYTTEELSTQESAQTILNTIFIEGLLIRRNYDHFSKKLSQSQTPSEIFEVLAQATKIGTDTVNKAFSPSLDQWLSLDSKMEGFLDSTIKSSSLNTASVLLSKVGN